MKAALKESLWLIAILAVSILAYQLFLANTGEDISIHDTYINVGHDESRSAFAANVFLVFISFSFLVYLLRVLFSTFKNVAANLILMLVTGIDIFFLGSGITVYTSTQSSGGATGLFYGSAPGFAIVHVSLKVLLIVTLAATAYMTGRNWK